MPYKNKKDLYAAQKRYRKRNPLFSLKRIKQAFWKEFHKSGELWFDYLGTEEENEASTNEFWRDFLIYLEEVKTE